MSFFSSHETSNLLVFYRGFRQEEREKELLRFTGGSTSVLVTTDLSSRGKSGRDTESP